MKRNAKRTFLVLLLVMILALVGCFVSGCDFGEEENEESKSASTSTTPPPVALAMVATDTITYDGMTISWDAVVNAEKYQVVIGEQQIYQGTATSCKYEDPGNDFTIRITAMPAVGSTEYKKVQRQRKKRSTWRW